MNLKQKLATSTLTLGSWVTIGHPSVVEILSQAGFEWLTIDMEHSPIGFETAQTLITVTQGCGMQSLVRVGRNDELIIKRVMDSGADGVIVPMVNSADDARRAVASAKYPPQGRRGVGLARAQKYGTGFDEYRARLEDEAVVIVQIEHVDAVRDIDSILAVDGVDGVIIGPYDLSGSMGRPGDFDCDEMKQAIADVEDACRRAGKPAGYHVIESDPASLQKRIDAGFTFLAYSLDFFFLGDAARKGMDCIRTNQEQK